MRRHYGMARALLLFALPFATAHAIGTITLAPGASITINPGTETVVSCAGAEARIIDKYCACPANTSRLDGQDLVLITVFSNGTKLQTVLDGYITNEFCMAQSSGPVEKRHPRCRSEAARAKQPTSMPSQVPAFPLADEPR